MPQLYNVTYFLTEANFIGDQSQADMTYSAQSSMHLKVLQQTHELTFNSLDLSVTQFSYVMDNWMSVCLCGYERQCLSHDCNEIIRPSG